MSEFGDKLNEALSAKNNVNTYIWKGKKENGKRVYEFGFATCKLGQKSYLEKLRLFSAIKKSSLSFSQ